MSNGFEKLHELTKATVLQITREGKNLAQGVYLPDAIMSFADDQTVSESYSDTGVFILLRGSFAYGKSPYVAEDQRTTREILFQSRNAAAQFVLGPGGRSNHWKNSFE